MHEGKHGIIDQWDDQLELFVVQKLDFILKEKEYRDIYQQFVLHYYILLYQV